MMKNIEEVFPLILESLPSIEWVGGGSVPIPNESEEMKNHLFLNLTLANPLLLALPAIDLLEKMRDTAFNALVPLIENVSVDELDTLIISIFEIPREGENIRLYRTRIKTDLLPILSKTNFLESVMGEESHRQDVMQIIQK